MSKRRTKAREEHVEVLKDSLWHRPKVPGESLQVLRLRDWADGSWTMHTLWDNVQYFSRSPEEPVLRLVEGNEPEVLSQTRHQFLDEMFHNRGRRGGEVSPDLLDQHFEIPEGFAWKRA